MTKLCTYNVKNLFLANEGSPKPQSEVGALIKTIGVIGADVLVLQEVGSSASLRTLNESLAHPYPHVHLLPGNSNRSIHIGILSRVEMSVTSHRDWGLTSHSGDPIAIYASSECAQRKQTTPLRFQRDLIQAECTVAGSGDFALFCVHLKSRANATWQTVSADEVRAAECRAIHDIISQYRINNPDRLLILLGDFNDRQTADTLSGLRPLSMVDVLTETFKRTGRNPTTYWPKRGMRIDGILACAKAAERICPQTVTIHANARARRASDHYPVSVDLIGLPDD
ncbi:MAG: endonuclease/exonuclease/phosphatase family protein [Gammaproteobacteria bacterium]|nr:endonuclease/exonuclease/phosphatase family protein [Gammaproteobacteria bacterium]